MAGEKEQEKHEEKKHWHLDKTVSISHILATASAIATLLIFGSKLDTRVSLLEQANSTQQKDATDFKAAIRQDIRDISSKLDRLIERSK